MTRCPACGHENQSGARFCSACATPMDEPGTAAREERKIVTVLFADLVGFTSRSEQLDPEDVRALLSPYYARLRAELERFGGTVEKFIGDAVMALFGAPVAHEDDPERAVRAALAIRDWVLTKEAELQLRIAVNTGEALVALGARPTQGEGMASGDVVNTTARLQARGAGQRRPGGGGDLPRHVAGDHVSRGRAGGCQGQGRADPGLGGGRGALAVRGRPRVRAAHAVGRPRRASSVRCRTRSHGCVTNAHRNCVTIVGVPGIGKSRLVAELFLRVDAEPERTDRAGGRVARCRTATGSPSGRSPRWSRRRRESWTPTRPSRPARSCGRPSPRRSRDPDDAQWIEAHLRPLAGLAGEGDAGMDRRDETFTAWRRFLRGARRAASAGARLRGPALGGRQPARLHRVSRRLGRRRADARHLHHAAGTAGTSPGMGRRQTQRNHRSRSHRCPTTRPRT